MRSIIDTFRSHDDFDDLTFADVEGFVTEQYLDFAGGFASLYAFIRCGDETVLVNANDEGLTIYSYAPQLLSLTTALSEDWEFDCGEMTTADPLVMTEDDYFGLHMQLADVSMPVLHNEDI